MEPIYHQSSWEASSSKRGYPVLQGEQTVDTVIIGAGITGLTAALCLLENGHNVAVVDAFQVGSGTSGGTSAHLSTLFDLGYAKLTSSYNAEVASLVAESMQKGVSVIRDFVQTHAIDCDFKEVPGYLFAEKATENSAVEDEAKAARAAGLQVTEAAVPLPFPITSGVQVAGQAQFHPLKYLQALAAAVVAKGGKLFEHSQVKEILNKDSVNTVVTASGRIQATSVVIATHTPIGLHMVQTQLTAERSFLLAFTSTQTLPDALFVDTQDPYHYIRSIPGEGSKGERLILVGGADRRVGHGPEEESFSELESWARAHFAVGRITNRWSAQLYEPADHLPYIGPSPQSKGQYLATGYSGDGLTLGSLAGWILAEQICQRQTPYDEIYQPVRLRLQGMPEMMAIGADAVTHMVTDRLPKVHDKKPSDLRPGEGAVLQHGLHKVAAYRTPEGVLKQFSAVCPHMAAVVHWNTEMKTFDCPWHGSRFDGCGKSLEGPCSSGLAEHKD